MYMAISHALDRRKEQIPSLPPVCKTALYNFGELNTDSPVFLFLGCGIHNPTKTKHLLWPHTSYKVDFCLKLLSTRVFLKPLLGFLAAGTQPLLSPDGPGTCTVGTDVWSSAPANSLFSLLYEWRFPLTQEGFTSTDTAQWVCSSNSIACNIIWRNENSYILYLWILVWILVWCFS